MTSKEHYYTILMLLTLRETLSKPNDLPAPSPEALEHTEQEDSGDHWLRHTTWALLGEPFSWRDYALA